MVIGFAFDDFFLTYIFWSLFLSILGNIDIYASNYVPFIAWILIKWFSNGLYETRAMCPVILQKSCLSSQ